VQHLLHNLTAGPSEGARAAGRSSAIPPDFGLHLIAIEHGVATVDIEPVSSLSAERLPVAVGQVVLSVASAPTVRGVALQTYGRPVQVPLPGGSLTDGPVTATDYVDLLSPRWRQPGAFGCSKA